MIHVGVLRYARGKYLRWAVALIVVSIAIYVTQGGGQPPNGGTWQGYVLGTVSALLVVWLAFLGIRKRRYSSTLGTVQGWTSAHIYLGSALLVVATLHSAGQLGMNVHTLAYALMCIVIVSGFYGIYTYVNYPHIINETRSGASRADLFSELYELDKHGRELGAKAPDDINLVVKSAIERTVIGGGVYAQLFAQDHSRFVQPTTEGGRGAEQAVSNRDQQPVIDFLSRRIPRTSKIAETELLQELLAIFCRRQAVLRKIARDIRLSGWVKVWLHIHVPLSIALLIALVVHIVTTFMYW